MGVKWPHLINPCLILIISRENVRIYYTKWMEDQAQSLIDQTTAQMKLSQPQPHSQVLIHQPVNVMPVMVARGPPGMGMMGGPMLRPGQVPLRGIMEKTYTSIIQYHVCDILHIELSIDYFH